MLYFVSWVLSCSCDCSVVVHEVVPGICAFLWPHSACAKGHRNRQDEDKSVSVKISSPSPGTLKKKVNPLYRINILN